MHVHAALRACHQGVPLRVKNSLRPSHLESSITDQQLAYVKVILLWQWTTVSGMLRHIAN